MPVVVFAACWSTIIIKFILTIYTSPTLIQTIFFEFMNLLIGFEHSYAQLVDIFNIFIVLTLSLRLGYDWFWQKLH